MVLPKVLDEVDIVEKGLLSLELFGSVSVLAVVFRLLCGNSRWFDLAFERTRVE